MIKKNNIISKAIVWNNFDLMLMKNSHPCIGDGKAIWGRDCLRKSPGIFSLTSPPAPLPYEERGEQEAWPPLLAREGGGGELLKKRKELS